MELPGTNGDGQLWEYNKQHLNSRGYTAAIAAVASRSRRCMQESLTLGNVGQWLIDGENPSIERNGNR